MSPNYNPVHCITSRIDAKIWIGPRFRVPKLKKFEINVCTFSILNIVVENKEKKVKIKRQILFTTAVEKL